MVMSANPFTSELAASLSSDLLDRFERYVRVGTQARRDRERSPSTPGQLELARMLTAELQAIGLDEVHLDENGYVTATLPGAAAAPTIGLIAHVDTSPDAPADGVEPIVHHGYDGGVIELPRGGTRLDPATMPELGDKRGHDIVTSSGDTLLGADDKAGVAAIMAAVAHLAAHADLPRPTLRIAFTPDEEIGEGASLFDIEGFGALCAYTIDGSDLGELQDETFSGDEAIVRISGVEVHPGKATGKLVNALRLASQVVAALPDDRLTPETTSDREGFIHPYLMSGSAGSAEIRFIIRDFDNDLLAEHVALLERVARSALDREPRAQIEVAVRRQYRNMREYLDVIPEAMTIADEAIRREGITPLRRPIRGGTDGSQLSEMGLPTPNIFSGAQEFHSVREWASLQDMSAAAATIVHLAEVWAARVVNPAGAARSG
jgi:tripeptide aminopeptidase